MSKMIEIRMMETTNGRYIHEQDVIDALEQIYHRYPTRSTLALMQGMKDLANGYAVHQRTTTDNIQPRKDITS